MITKNTAHEWSIDRGDRYWLLASIRVSIYEAIFNQKLYCEWASPIKYDLSDEDVIFIESYMSDLDLMGYTVKKAVEVSPNKRIKLFIGWE